MRENPFDNVEIEPPRCTLPKHKGKLWSDVVEEDREYVEWVVSGEGPEWITDELYDYLMELLEG